MDPSAKWEATFAADPVGALVSEVALFGAASLVGDPGGAFFEVALFESPSSVERSSESTAFARYRATASRLIPSSRAIRL